MKVFKFILAVLALAAGVPLTAAAAASGLSFGAIIAPVGLIGSTLLPKCDAPNDKGAEAPKEPTMAEQIGEAVARSVGVAVKETILSDEVRQALLGDRLDTSGGRQSAGLPDLGGATAGADRNKEGEKGLLIQSSKIFRGVLNGNRDWIKEAVQDLIDMGAYRDQGIETRDGYTTLTDADGGVFLPTVIADQVLRQQAQMGAIYPNATVVPVPRGKLKFPNLTAGLTGYWAAETTGAKARKATFDGVELDPEMILLLVPWTVQMDDEASAQLLPIVLEKLAEAFALVIDDAAINGDGSASYGGITGLKNNSDVGAFSAATGHTTPATLDWVDWAQLPFKADYRARPFGSYIVHPDMIQYLLILRDDNNRPLYSMFGNPATGLIANTLFGRPVLQSVKAPDPANVTTGTEFAYFGKVSDILIGEKHQLQTEVFNTGTITDVDDNTEINLLTQYYKVMRAAQGVDVQIGLGASFAAGSTA